jgi:hypothetical protein
MQNLIRIRIQGFDYQKWGKMYRGLKIAIYLALASIKDVQATAEAFSLEKRTSGTSKHENY